MKSMSKPVKKILTFLAITLGLSSIYYYFIISGGTLMVGGGLFVLGLMWAPGIAGIITQLIFERSLRGMGWKPGRIGYLGLALVIPFLYGLVVYGITWATGLGGFPNPELLGYIRSGYGATLPTAVVILIFVVMNFLIGILPGIFSGLGEEIGWRGLFVPELAKVTRFPFVALISGVVWALWHLPLLFFADYNMAGAPTWYAGIMFTILVIGISFAFAWLRLKSGSLWTAAVMHASHNLFIQSVFTPLTLQKPVTPYIIDEFGVGLAIAAIVVAIIFWRKSKELPLAVETA